MALILQGARLPNANPSPRVVGGVLKWYAGDTFDLVVAADVIDQDGETVQLTQDHRMEFCFRNTAGETVHTVTCADLTAGTATVVFDEAVTARFPAGRYTYDGVLVGDVRRTLIHRAPIHVE